MSRPGWLPHNEPVVTKASLMRAVSALRGGIRSWTMLALLVAVAGGAIVSVAAGARRAESAYPRFLQAEHAADVFVFLSDNSSALQRHITQLPDVAGIASALVLAPTSTNFTPVVLTDPKFGSSINRFKLLAGRRPFRAGEAMVGFTLAGSQHLHVGSKLVLRPPAATHGPATTVRIVGIEAAVREFPPLLYGTEQTVYLAPPFLQTATGRAWAGRAQGGAAMLAVRLRGGALDDERFLSTLERLAGQGVGTETQSDENVNVERSMHFQGLALWLLAGIAALVVAIVLAQLLLRQLGADSSDQPTLRALGMTSTELALSDVLRVAALGVAGAAGAVLVAWLASPLFPLGTARVAEPSPGLAFDPLAIGLGAVAVLALVVVLGTCAAWVVVRRTATRRKLADGTTLSVRLGLQSLPVVPATGVRLALGSGHGAQAVPVRTTICAVAVGIGAVAAAVTFGTSLGHLLDTPALYGVTYNADVELNSNFGDIRSTLPALRNDPEVAAVTVAEMSIPLRSGQTTFGGEGVLPVTGSVLPPVIQGRLPHTAGEIALGKTTLTQLHAAVGDTVQVAVEGVTRPLPMRVVGTTVLPTFSQTQSLGKGGVVTPAALNRFLSHARPGFSAPPPGDALVRFRSGVSPAAGIQELTARLGGVGSVLISTPTQPSDVADFGQVQALPNVLAGLLAALAVAAMAYLLVSMTGRQRRDLAVLKTIGFVPRQVFAAVSWQSTTVAFIAAVVGLPIGVVAGRALWSAVAGQIGVVTETTVPWLIVGVLLPAALLMANLVAVAPAAAAARIRPAEALRSE